MNKNRFQLFIIIALLVSNVLLIVFIILPKKPHGFHPDKPRNIIIDRLQFNNSQIEAYDNLIALHRKAIREKDNKIIGLKNKLYLNLTQNDSNDSTAALINEISTVQQQIETIHFQHFMDIKSICTNEQLGNYNNLVLDFSKIFSPQPPPPPKH